MRHLLAPLLVFALTLGAARAEDASPEAESLRLARLVVEGSGLSRSFHGLTEAMRADFSRATTTRPELATDLEAALIDMRGDFDAEADSMTAKAATLYAQKLSRRELADCAVFFAGASGKAYVAAQPAVMVELGPAMEVWRRTAAITLTTRLREKLRAKGKDF